MSYREAILDTIDDMVVDFLYYDRKECDHLPMDAIEGAIASGEITADEIVRRFEAQLLKGLNP